jgi:anti-sigma factor RsiW
MSSDYHHIIPMLTRDNYEEAFLLYVDNELTPEQRNAVEAFVLLHPDLKEELDLLCGTKLSDRTPFFENKESLLADSMKVNTVDESLLLYIDNELPAWEKEAVEAQLQKDAAFAAQHALLLKTKS